MPEEEVFPMSKSKQRRKRRQFSSEFKADAVQLCLAGDRSIKQIAKDLDLTETSLRSWVRSAEETGSTEQRLDALSSAEREELRALRKENRELRRDREILKKAAAFFARDPK